MTDRIPQADAVDEGRRLGGAALAAGVALKLTGGVAVALRCPSARAAPLRRDYADVDVVGRARDSAAITTLLEEQGYEADTAFNAVHGSSRMYFWDAVNERQLDVFLDQVEMCHRIDLRSRLDADEATLTLADLLLMKLQIVETNQKDYLDILALLVDQPFSSKDSAGVDLAYLAALAADDWGLWKTTTTVAERAAEYAAGLADFEKTDHVRAQVNRYLHALEEAPKSRRWKLRDRIGERRRWYELPEESH
jgi:hypothetical protein